MEAGVSVRESPYLRAPEFEIRRHFVTYLHFIKAQFFSFLRLYEKVLATYFGVRFVDLWTPDSYHRGFLRSLEFSPSPDLFFGNFEQPDNKVVPLYQQVNSIIWANETWNLFICSINSLAIANPNPVPGIFELRCGHLYGYRSKYDLAGRIRCRFGIIPQRKWRLLSPAWI